jgi:hypothetical protein
MNHTNLKVYAFAGLALFAALVCFGECTGCSAAKPPFAEAAYLAQQIRCVDLYDTRPMIESCRAEVRRKWGIDAGTEAGQ